MPPKSTRKKISQTTINAKSKPSSPGQSPFPPEDHSSAETAHAEQLQQDDIQKSSNLLEQDNFTSQRNGNFDALANTVLTQLTMVENNLKELLAQHS